MVYHASPMAHVFRLLPCLLLAGCLTPPKAPTGSPGVGLPVYPWQGAHAALMHMTARDAKLTSVRLRGTLKLEESADKSVLLEAILVMETKPGQSPQLRLQASKLGRTAFDLTLNDQGVWLVDGREKKDDPKNGAADAGSNGMAQMAKGLQRLAGGQVWTGAKAGPEQAATFTVLLDDAGRAKATLHKAALVPLAFDFQTPDGPVHLRLEHAPITAADGAVFPLPCKLAADAPHGRKFSFEAQQLEANPVLPAAVFTPPKNAALLKSK